MTHPLSEPPSLVEFTAKIPREHHEAFVGLFPQYGATSWFIRTALEQFLKRVENDPTAIERIKEAINEMAVAL